MRWYVDTSALAKWYLNEAKSAEFTAWIKQHAPVYISTLTLLEMQSLLARRRREGEIDYPLELQIDAAMVQDIEDGHLVHYEVENQDLQKAMRLFARVPQEPLRSLDALQLSVALRLGSGGICTADRTVADIAIALDLDIARFD